MTTGAAAIEPAPTGRCLSALHAPHGVGGYQETVGVGACARNEQSSVTVRPIITLRGTALHATSVETYRRHHGDVSGLCDSCGCPWPCPSRIHAAEVIEAAEPVDDDSEDPRRADRHVTSVGTERAAEPVCVGQAGQRPVMQVLSATAIGYPLGGVNRRPVTGCNWER